MRATGGTYGRVMQIPRESASCRNCLGTRERHTQHSISSNAADPSSPGCKVSQTCGTGTHYCKRMRHTGTLEETSRGRRFSCIYLEAPLTGGAGVLNLERPLSLADNEHGYRACYSLHRKHRGSLSVASLCTKTSLLSGLCHAVIECGYH